MKQNKIEQIFNKNLINTFEFDLPSSISPPVNKKKKELNNEPKKRRPEKKYIYMFFFHHKLS